MDRKVCHGLIALIMLWTVLSHAGIAGSADEKPAPVVTQDRFFTEWGFYSGVGEGYVTEGPYRPIFFILHLGVDLKRWIPPLQGHRGTLSLYLEPQVNPSGTPKQNVELGIGVGVKYLYRFGDALGLYGQASVGPHYITLNTVDQAQGFLFANTVGGGVNVFLSPGSALDIGYRLRHLSNAGSRLPNHGINSDILLIGFSLFY
jgi:hypothetical protein